MSTKRKASPRPGPRLRASEGPVAPDSAPVGGVARSDDAPEVPWPGAVGAPVGGVARSDGAPEVLWPGAAGAEVDGVARSDGPPEVLWPGAVGVEPVRSRFALSPEVTGYVDIAITIAGVLVATLLGAALAIFEALYSPFRMGGYLVPVSLVLALVTNPLLGWFAYATTRRRMVALLPAAAWWGVWILATVRTTEGDLIINGNNWVGLLTLLAGSVAFAIGIYMSTMRQRVAPSRMTDPTPPAPSGT